MDVENTARNIWISIGILTGIGMIVAFVRTSVWFSKSNKEIIDLPTLGKFLLYILGTTSTVLLFVGVGISLWFLFILKTPYHEKVESIAKSLQTLLKMFLIISFILKTLDIIHLIIRQTAIDIFFMDWERSKAGTLSNISAWRTCFVANEFNEIQTFRRINVTFHLLFALFLIKVVKLEYLTSTQSNLIFPESSFNHNHTIEYEHISRTGTSFIVLLSTALIQYLFYIIFYQRCIEDKILNFIDLCSVSNISIFILDQHHHGYYIHGRSPHGLTDVNMKDIILNLERESNQMSGKRGLQPNSMEQIFIMKINRSFRLQYDDLFRKYHGFQDAKCQRKSVEHHANVLLESYRDLNSFLCGFIDHSLPTHQYIVRNRYLLEKLLNYEFQIGVGHQLAGYIDNLLFVDDEKQFTNVLFYGEENSLFLFNVITFLFIDIIFMNYIFAAITTYLLNLIIVNLRNSLARRNLSRKTLVPRQLLI